jgi:microcystin-dependent protein
MTTTQNKALNITAFNATGWDVPLNANENILDAAFGGQASINVTGVGTGPTALTDTQYQNMSLSFGGTLSNDVNYQLPASVQGQWVIINNTSGAFALTISSATGAGATLSISQGTTRSIYCDGTNIQYADSQVPINLATDVTGVLPAANGGIPTGAVLSFAMSTAPTGWLECNGSAISRSTYSSLFSAIGTTFGSGDGSTTFNLPDMRGEFARGWDHGRGVDSGRSFGSTQADAYRSHNHGVNDPTHAHIVSSVATNGSFGPTGSAPYPNGTTTTSFSATGISIQNSGGTETRPVNVALLYCIKT